jgi:preprotein translocase subunit YajC
VIALLNHAALFAATSSTKKTSTSPYSFIFIIVIVAAVYFLFLRPQQQRARRQREQMSTVDIGDEVLTAGGIIGRVIDTQPDRIVIESGADDGTFGAAPARMVVLRSAISRKLEPAVATDDYDDEDEDEEHDEDADGHHDEADSASESHTEEEPGA